MPGKTAVAGAKDRDTGRIHARVVPDTRQATLQGFVADVAAPGATVYTDEARAYLGMPFNHEAVGHNTGEFVRGMAHTNGMESFWSMLKRGYVGTFHKLSPEAPRPLRDRVRGTSKHPERRHHRPDGRLGDGHV